MTKIASDTDRLAELTAERDELVRLVVSPKATGEVTRKQIDAALVAARKSRADHIRQLGRYNHIKDAAQELIGMVAEMRECRVVDVMRDFGIDDDDDD